MRKLASIQEVREVISHPNADRLEIAVVQGWRVVTRLGEVKPGDKVVYFEVDSFLPETPEFEFLRNNSYRKHPILGQGFRLKTVKLRGELSQGLITPIHTFPSLSTKEIGDDVTEELDVKKWEDVIPTHLQGLAKGSFPFYVRKTELERIQNCYDDIKLLEQEYGPIIWLIEEKLDGTSMTIYHDPEKGSGVCSRNLELKIEGNETNSYVRIAQENKYLEFLERYGKPLALQGELCGPGIQNNIYSLNQLRFYIFDIWLIDQQRYCNMIERSAILQDLISLGMKVYEVPFFGFWSKLLPLEECLERADGRSGLNPKTLCEGIAVKSAELIRGNICSFKIISNNFLLKLKD